MTKHISKYKHGGTLPSRIYLGEEGGSNVSGESVFEKAVELERQGKSNEDIRQETGWFRNPHDKKWRFEISDKNAIFDDQEIDNIKEYIGKSKKVDRVALSKVLSHPALFRAYPDIKELEIAFFYASDKPKAFVTYNKQGNTEIIYNFYHEEKTVLEGINARVDRSSVIRGRRSGIIHEIQHVIQVRSRLGKGSSTLWEFNQLLAEQQRIGGGISDTEKDIILKKAQENYWKSSGEIESREVENRIDLTQEQLSIHIPFDKIDFIGSPIVRINRPDDKFGLGGEVESDATKKKQSMIVTNNKEFKMQRFEKGKKLSDSQKREVYATMRDSYKELKRPYTFEETERGEKKTWLDDASEYMVKSDITGRMIRWFITLPDGIIAHPTELFPNVTVPEMNSAERNIQYNEGQSELRYNKVIDALKKAGEIGKVVSRIKTAMQNGAEFIDVYDSADIGKKNSFTRLKFSNGSSWSVPQYTILADGSYLGLTDSDLSELRNTGRGKGFLHHELAEIDWKRFLNEFEMGGEATNENQMSDLLTEYYEDYLSRHLASDLASAKWNKFISDRNGKLPSGLVKDEVRNTTEYKRLKADFDAENRKVRELNKGASKKFRSLSYMDRQKALKMYKEQFEKVLSEENKENKMNTTKIYKSKEDPTIKYWAEEQPDGKWFIFSESSRWPKRNEDIDTKTKEDAELIMKEMAHITTEFPKRDVDRARVEFNKQDVDQLSKGTEVELEHKDTIEEIASGKLSPEEGAKEIAKDHIAEDPAYYDKLETIEGKKEDTIIAYTDAKDNYDGFGTKTIEVTPYKTHRGDSVRKIELPVSNHSWQSMRYMSGNRSFMTESDFDKHKDVIFTKDEPKKDMDNKNSEIDYSSVDIKSMTEDQLNNLRDSVLDDANDLSSLYKSQYGSMDIESPMSSEEKELKSKIASLLSVANEIVMEKRKRSKEIEMEKTNPQEDWLFIGVYPTGEQYSDRTVTENGDYRKIAFVFNEPRTHRETSNLYRVDVENYSKKYQGLIERLKQQYDSTIDTTEFDKRRDAWMKKQLKEKKTAYNYVYDRLMKVAPDLMNMLEQAEYPSDVYGKSQYRTDDFGGNDAFMYLAVEGLEKDEKGRYLLSISHYYKQQGDMMCDPCMTVRLDPELKTVEAFSFKMDGSIGQSRLHLVYGMTKDGKEGVNLKEKKSQNSFLNTWSSNWVKQGHKVEFRPLPEKEMTGTPISAEAQAIIQPEWDKMQEFLNSPSESESVQKAQNRKTSLEYQREKFPIVVEWSEGSGDENIGFDSIEQLGNWLHQMGYTDTPEETYIKNKVWFKGYTSYVRIDISKQEADFDPQEDDLLTWLVTHESTQFNWAQFSEAKTQQIIQDANFTFFKGVHANYDNQFKLNKAIEEFLDSKTDDYVYGNEEKEFIYGYEGYGGLEKHGATGVGLLFEYYTPKNLIEKMWGLAYKYGFSTGKVLEPSVGVGRFLNYTTHYDTCTAYEISPYSAKICKIIHPKTNVIQKSFAEHFYKGNTFNPKFEKDFDLVIGNPPYGKMTDLRTHGENSRIGVSVSQYEHYFILRGLDCLKSGGLLVYVSTANLFTKGYEKLKEKISEKADLVDGYLLPNTTFKQTKVNTSLIVLRRK